MKKWIAIWMVLCLLTPVFALADGSDDAAQYAIIYSPGLADRLNLRSAPSQDADTQGRYYTGTVVRVNEKGDEWSSVYIGRTAIQYGYMKNEYLVFFDSDEDLLYGHPGHGYETEIFRARLKYGAKLYDSYLNPGEPVRIHRNSEPFIVLGDVNDDWLHVQQGNESYYVKRQDISSRFNYGMAVVISDKAEDRLNLRAAPEDGSKIIGKVYAGTLMSVQRVTNGYAQITMVGEGRNCGVPVLEEQNQYLTCYVDADYLRWGFRADLMGLDSFLPVAETRWTAATYQMNNVNQITGTLDKGMRMQVLGMRGNGDYLYVDLGEAAPVLIKASDVKVMDFYSQHGLPVLGYGIITNAKDVMQEYGLVPYYTDCTDRDAAFGCDEGDTVEILGLSDDWAQIRYWSMEGFIPRKYVQPYLTEDLLHARAGVEDGLFTFINSGDDTLTLQYADGHIRTLQGKKGEYTLFIPAGTILALNGGELTAIDMDRQFISPEFPVFRGSGRYLCGPHMMSRRGWEYKITPLDPAQEAWYSISTFEKEDAGAQAARVILDPDALWDADTQAVCVEDGEFLEFHNCIVEIYYGNG